MCVCTQECHWFQVKDNQLEIIYCLPVSSDRRVDATRTGLLTSVAFMGAPAIQDEKLASGNETVLALRTLQQALACGVCRGEGEEGGIAVASRTLPSGAQAWVPDCEALSRIDVGPNADIPLVIYIRYPNY